MECPRVQADLIPYHLGALDVDGPDRDAIDAHLMACGACLRAYLQLKRQLDAALGPAAHGEGDEADGPQPSEAARLRLRAEVARSFRPTAGARLFGFLRRPIPLYQGVFAMALLLLVLQVVPLLRGEAYPAPLQPLAEQVDTARQLPANVRIY